MTRHTRWLRHNQNYATNKQQSGDDLGMPDYWGTLSEIREKHHSSEASWTPTAISKAAASIKELKTCEEMMELDDGLRQKMKNLKRKYASCSPSQLRAWPTLISNTTWNCYSFALNRIPISCAQFLPPLLMASCHQQRAVHLGENHS